ncbi:MAG: hypothetical protein SFX73_09570 [Kofleriaceae bacterium]|nr:hypothetical protein [Kofleriaceae bacterium]
MRAAVAFALTLATLAGGCFPNSKHRTVAKVVEGGLAIGGVVLLATVNSSADCKGLVAGDKDRACEDKAQLMSTLGLGMILTGLLGFVVTVSTAPDDKPETPVSTTPKPSTTLEPAPVLTPAPAEPAPPAAPPASPANPETPPGATPPAPETPAS